MNTRITRDLLSAIVNRGIITTPQAETARAIDEILDIARAVDEAGGDDVWAELGRLRGKLRELDVMERGTQ